MSTGSVAVTIEGTTFERMAEILKTVDIELRNKWIRAGVSAAVKVAEQAAKELAPKSAITGTTKKLSKKTKLKRAGKPSLYQAITSKVKVYSESGVTLGMVGAGRPGGSHGHLLESGHRAVYWGRRSGDVIAAKKWLGPAVDQTHSLQQSVIIETMETGIKTSGG